MKKLHFKTNVQLKNIIGRDLINDDNVAIQELIKNSYDSGSKDVQIIFRNIKSNRDKETSNKNRGENLKKLSKIFIIDSGVGMDEKDIIDKWLNIAYSSKKIEDTKFGRKMAGEKGVGRFSCDRLGEFLDIYTRTKKENKINHLTINWNDFEIDSDLNYEIQKVDILLNESLTEEDLLKRIGIRLGKSGTILEISKLREKWISPEGKGFNYDLLISLKTFLEKLTNPNQDIDSNQFKIYLKIEDISPKDFSSDTKRNKSYSFLNEQLVKNKIFKNLSFKVTRIVSEISDDGKEVTTSLLHRDELIFRVREKNHFNLLKGIKINLYFLNQYSKAYFKRYTGIDTVRFGSILLFVNGFRISPFGDFGNDWLGLELRKGQGRARYMGARDMIGRIEINNLSKREFKIISNREGLAKNNYYKQLVGKNRDDFIHSYFYSIFRKLEVFVVDGLDWDRIKESASSEEDLDEEGKSTVKNFMTSFQKEISSAKWKYDPLAERYLKTEKEKKQLILDQLSKIIYVGTNKKDIISLYINENLILDLAEENVAKLDSLLGSIKNFDESKFDIRTSKGVNKIKQTLQKLEESKERETGKRKKAEEKAEEVMEKLAETKEQLTLEREKIKKKGSQILFLQSLINRETKEILGLQHQIKTSASTIKNYVSELKLTPIEKIDQREYTKILDIILIENEKIRSIVEFVTQANFNLKSSEIEEDIVTFIKQYVQNVYPEITKKYHERELKITFKNDISFIKEFKPLEITIILDNLISNSLKALSKNIEISFSKERDTLIISFKDDGKGIKESELKDIFDFGYTTTDGSGIGLYFIKEIIHGMGGAIYVKSKKNSGTEFVIKIPK